MEFNPNEPYIMHIDINSCFATIEQQANPFLRGRPTVVAAYAENYGCILASSYEAKKLGIKTGMRVYEARIIYPNLFVLAPDPPKYRMVHLALEKIISRYTNKFVPRSIDEFVLDLNGYPCLVDSSQQSVARDIKQKVREEIGEWITVSIGIGPNRFLAKTGASLHKPDGLDEINKNNFLEVYSKLELTDLCGINKRNKIRLNRFGIYNVCQFYKSSIQNLRGVFGGIVGRYWYLRLRGYEVDDFSVKRKSFGNSYVLPKAKKIRETYPIIMKLVQKMVNRVQKKGFLISGVHIFFVFSNHTYWHKGKKLYCPIYDFRDVYREILKLVEFCPHKNKIKQIAVTSFNLSSEDRNQVLMFESEIKKRNLNDAFNLINKKYGDFSICAARMAKTEGHVLDRIAFGSSEVS